MSISLPQPEEVPPSRATKLAALRQKARPVAFAVMCGSVTLDILNVTGLAFDQVNISDHFGVDLPTASWSLSAYALTFGSFLLLAGRAGAPTLSNLQFQMWISMDTTDCDGA